MEYEYGLKKEIQQTKIIFKTEKFVQNYFKTEGSGHDWWHIFRVRNMALELRKSEGGDPFIIEMAALLHDLDDWKLKKEDDAPNSRQWLKKVAVPKGIIELIEEIINEVSFKGAGIETPATTIEAKIVQDADRLDAIGAIGIARAFAYGGNKGRLIYDPNVKSQLHQNFDAYKKGDSPTIHHFYEKLLLLKDRLNTVSAKNIAKKRHRFMEMYIEQFFNEWENKS